MHSGTFKLRWYCSCLSLDRISADKEAGKITSNLMHPAILKGMAPAMQCNWRAAYWGMQLQEEADDATRALLVARDTTFEALHPTRTEAWPHAFSARQCLAETKGAFGIGITPEFPAEFNQHILDDNNVCAAMDRECVPGDSGGRLGATGCGGRANQRIQSSSIQCLST